ncbi:AraC-type DNA-binding protein [Anaerocolumna jejuensis DSM 15929]|uniref:AraC-type DNA-binding protein n=1 Tax=Anaerocolumna jejuensis DSM 15929 TaxID=1121322 RepID=A0A1M6MXQ9_9FIRM|nr:helix-turn-helix domain-containing protein [Anaerocolumna jejuensis]SHJ88236.1 AraC-type DNA-binding protein [Anaerocolumna jejuensis DSM 15929]
MQNQSSFKKSYHYRHYNLPLSFPSIAFLGDSWVLPDTPLEYLHFHNCIEIGHCLSGSGTLHIENIEYEFHAGDICFISENIAHISKSSLNQTSKWEYIYLNPSLLFEKNFPGGKPESLLICSPYLSKAFPHREEPYLHFLTCRMFAEFHEKGPNYQDALRGLFLTLLTVLYRHIPEQLSEHSTNLQIHSALLYIHKHYAQKLQIGKIAALCHLSEPHFRRKFLEVMHISPLDYINHYRIRTSCYEIYRNEKPLNQIAKDVGFTTLSSFNRQFHSLLGSSPTEWCRNMIFSKDHYEIVSLDDDSSKNFFTL